MDLPVSELLGDPVGLSQRLLVATVIVVLVFSGPLVPGLSFADAGPPSTIGDGNATVSAVTVDADAVAITPGRFGSGVDYLRAPDARVDVESVSGAPRIVYVLEVPDLDAEITATRLLDGPGAAVVRPSERAFSPGTEFEDEYRGELTVRVQSLSTDRSVYSESVTVEVRT